jgi:hypothetical protein
MNFMLADPNPDPDSGEGAAGPGGAVILIHIKGPQETVKELPN